MTTIESPPPPPKILVLATASCAYPGADNVGQNRVEYPTNVYVLRVPAPVVFPEQFYLQCFEKGIGGIIVMSCGLECPYVGAYEGLSARIARVYKLMRERQMNTRRLRMCAICTVCSKSFLKELRTMNEQLTGNAVLPNQ
jgi:F420-non-reducing hydrogenase iron-sulfur subunit